jgi:hypothetical protein
MFHFKFLDLLILRSDDLFISRSMFFACGRLSIFDSILDSVLSLLLGFLKWPLLGLMCYYLIFILLVGVVNHS